MPLPHLQPGLSSSAVLQQTLPLLPVQVSLMSEVLAALVGWLIPLEEILHIAVVGYL